MRQHEQVERASQAMPWRTITVALLCWLPVGCTVRNYPSWRPMKPAVQRVGPLDAWLWVSKSGKQGMGVTLRLGNPSSEKVSLDSISARLHVKDGIVVSRSLSDISPIPAGASTFLYLPLAFDNQREWNEGRRRAVLELTFRLRAKDHRWQLRFSHELRGGYHRIPAAAPEPNDIARAAEEPFVCTHSGPWLLVSCILKVPTTAKGSRRRSLTAELHRNGHVVAASSSRPTGKPSLYELRFWLPQRVLQGMALPAPHSYEERTSPAWFDLVVRLLANGGTQTTVKRRAQVIADSGWIE